MRVFYIRANPAHKPKLKRELIDALGTDWGRLAVSPAGSHVLEACYGTADQRTRENIVSAMARVEKQISTTRHGPHLLRRLGVTQFQQEPEQWRNRVQVAEDVKADFAKTFGVAEEDDDDGGAAAAGDEGGGGGGGGTKRKKEDAAAAGRGGGDDKPSKKEKKESKTDEAMKALGVGGGDEDKSKKKDRKDKKDKKGKKDKKKEKK